MSDQVDTKAQHDKLFEEEFYPHMDALYNFAFHLTYNEDDSSDLVQETYLKAYRFIESYETGTNAKAWLFKILKNAFINEYRKKSKQPVKVDYEELLDFHEMEHNEQVGNLDMRQDVFQNMMGDEVSKALNGLPVDFRTVILLCDIDGFTYEEISKITDIPIGTVRSRLHRARGLLKENLGEYAQSMGFIEKEK